MENVLGAELKGGIPGLSAGGALANAVVVLILFVASRFVRVFWSPVSGDVLYWLLAFYTLVCLARLRIDLFRWIRNPDTSFGLNMIVCAVASFGVISGLRIATAPLITRAITFIG